MASIGDNAISDRRTPTKAKAPTHQIRSRVISMLDSTIQHPSTLFGACHHFGGLSPRLNGTMARVWGLLTIGPGSGKPVFRTRSKTHGRHGKHGRGGGLGVDRGQGGVLDRKTNARKQEKGKRKSRGLQTIYHCTLQLSSGWNGQRNGITLSSFSSFSFVVAHGDQLSALICIWRKRLRGSFEVNSHSLGGWEEALHMVPQLFSRLRGRRACIPGVREK